MNDQIAQELVKWMQGLGEFAEREAPMLAADIVSWTLWSGLAYGVVALVVMVAAAYVFRLGWHRFHTADAVAKESLDPKVYKPAWDDMNRSATVMVISTVVLAASILTAATQLRGALMAYTAPRLTVVEYLR